MVQPSTHPFGQPPNTPTIQLRPFKAHIPQRDIDDLNDRISNAADIVTTFENSFTDEDLGVKKSWMDETLAYWRNDFDWRKVEDELNGYANYTTTLKTRQHSINVHFIGLFSKKQDAIPVVMSHGWPGSVLEFLPLLKHLTSTYTPEDLPVHLILPSLPGFGFSGPLPRHDVFTNLDTATLWDGLMRGLGFEGYLAQGGDVGSRVTRLLAENFEGCKAIHLNAFHLHPPVSSFDKYNFDEDKRKLVERAQHFEKFECGYNVEQSTKPATLAIAIGSDPAAMLAWIGEKFLSWTDETPPLDVILSDVTLYWLTRTFATSLYNYHTSYGSTKQVVPGVMREKPVGYSLFEKELRPYPVEVLQDYVDVVWSKRHAEGGHFAALEKPVVLWDDLLEFAKQVWS